MKIRRMRGTTRRRKTNRGASRYVFLVSFSSKKETEEPGHFLFLGETRMASDPGGRAGEGVGTRDVEKEEHKKENITRRSGAPRNPPSPFL